MNHTIYKTIISGQSDIRMWFSVSGLSLSFFVYFHNDCCAYDSTCTCTCISNWLSFSCSLVVSSSLSLDRPDYYSVSSLHSLSFPPPLSLSPCLILSVVSGISFTNFIIFMCLINQEHQYINIIWQFAY